MWRATSSLLTRREGPTRRVGVRGYGAPVRSVLAVPEDGGMIASAVAAPVSAAAGEAGVADRLAAR